MTDSFSFVFRRGETSSHVPSLIDAVKQMLEPCTYPNFKMRKSNNIKDLIAVSAELDVNFFVQFSSNGEGTNMHLVKTPHGPTLLFKMVNYTVET